MHRKRSSNTRWASVVSLFLRGGPAAVPGFVVSVVVDPVDGHLAGIAIRKRPVTKHRVFVPLPAYRDTPAVPVPVSNVGVQAAPPHVAPDDPQRATGFTVCVTCGGYLCDPQPADAAGAAGGGVAVRSPQAGAGDPLLSPALTAAEPVDVAAPVLVSRQDGKLANVLAGKVRRRHRH